MSTASDLYEQDFYAWTQAQVALLKAGHWTEIDTAHLVEEIESMGASERRELANRLRELLLHLLKWRHQPGLRGARWAVSIANQRDGVDDLLEASPSLRADLEPAVSKAYARARRNAAGETGLSIATFPETCPFTLAQILDDNFWPED